MTGDEIFLAIGLWWVCGSGLSYFPMRSMARWIFFSHRLPSPLPIDGVEFLLLFFLGLGGPVGALLGWAMAAALCEVGMIKLFQNPYSNGVKP